MRLINADALPSALFQKHVHDKEELEPILYFEDAVKVVEDAPTIDAIPVEYLMKYAQLPTEFAIAAWRKQDKDAQKKQIKRLDKPMSFDDALNLVNEVFPLEQKEQEAR